MLLQVSGISRNSFRRCNICDLNRLKLLIDNQPANREMEMEVRTCTFLRTHQNFEHVTCV